MWRGLPSALNLGLLLLVLSGCTGTVTTTSSAPGEAAQSPMVVVLLSGQRRQYLDLTDAISLNLRVPYVVLSMADQGIDDIHATLHELNPSAVVAVGQPALEFATTRPHGEVIYSHVLVPPPKLRGVDALPPFSLQLAQWRSVNPALHSLGVVGGARVGALMQALHEAGRDAGLEVLVREVDSNEAALHSFRAMVPQIDGLVLMPDAQVLSPTTIGNVIAHARRNDIPVLVYSEAMYEFGASLLVSADAADAARQIGRLLRDSSLKTLPLTQLRIRQQGAMTGEAG